MESNPHYNTKARASQQKYNAVQDFRGIKYELLIKEVLSFITTVYHLEGLRKKYYLSKNSDERKDLLLKIKLSEIRMKQKAVEMNTEFNLKGDRNV